MNDPSQISENTPSVDNDDTPESHETSPKTGKGVGLSAKLTGLVIGSVMFTALVIGSVSFLVARYEIHTVEQEKLLSLTETRKATIEDYLLSIEQDTRTLANSETVQNATLQFSAAWSGTWHQASGKTSENVYSGQPSPGRTKAPAG